MTLYKTCVDCTVIVIYIKRIKVCFDITLNNRLNVKLHFDTNLVT